MFCELNVVLATDSVDFIMLIIIILFISIKIMKPLLILETDEMTKYWLVTRFLPRSIMVWILYILIHYNVVCVINTTCTIQYIKMY